MNQLKGKTAIVTGAARGIGFAISQRFLEEGASLLMCDIDHKKLLADADSITSDSHTA